ncbi:MAG: sce7726 family protein [Ewingella sp.]
MNLNDKEIRTALVDFLENQRNKPRRVIHELSVSNGNAIADVVAIYNESHCFEIKGDGDKIERIKTQGIHYNLAFRKITVVTTAKYADKALEYAPFFWGIIIAKKYKENVNLKYLRKSLVNPFFDKKIALQTLWKEELIRILDSRSIEVKNKDKNKTFIGEVISEKLGVKELSENISSILILRKSSFFKHVG